MRQTKQDTPRLLATLAVALVPALAAAGQGKADSKASAAHQGGAHVVQSPDTIQWSPAPPSIPEGAQVAVLEGDPKQKGIFTMRLKAPAGYQIPAHTHPRHERITVISGKFQIGLGRDVDESKLKSLPAGTFFVMTPGTEHFARAAEDTVVQLTGEGPWEINYVRASDDPRNRRQAAGEGRGAEGRAQGRRPDASR